MKELIVKNVKDATQKAANLLGISEEDFNKNLNITQRAFYIKKFLK